MRILGPNPAESEPNSYRFSVHNARLPGRYLRMLAEFDSWFLYVPYQAYSTQVVSNMPGKELNIDYFASLEGRYA
jgi:hypothetical protein